MKTAATFHFPINFLRACIFAALFALCGQAAAQERGASIAARAGTLGHGLELKFPLSQKINLRLAANRFEKTYDKTSAGGTVKGDYTATLDMNTDGAIFDWHPGGGGFRFSFGAFSNGNKLTAETTGSEITLNDNTYTGDANLSLEFESTSPYFGIGWSSHTDSGLSLDFELGAMFQTPILRVDGTGTISGSRRCQFSVNEKSVADVCNNGAALKADLEAEHKRLVEDLEVHPVLSIGLQLRF